MKPGGTRHALAFVVERADRQLFKLLSSRRSTLAVRKTLCCLAISAAAFQSDSGIGPLPRCDFRHRSKRY